MIVYIYYNDEFDEREIIELLDGVGYSYVNNGWYDYVLINSTDVCLVVDLSRRKFTHSGKPYFDAPIIFYSTATQLKVELVAAALSIDQNAGENNP